MEGIMEPGLREKFAQNPKLQQKLSESRGKVIGEATRKESAWGIGFNLNHRDVLDSSKWTGFNLLGKMLVKLRTS